MEKKYFSFIISVAMVLLIAGSVTSSYATLIFNDWVLFPGSTSPIPSGITAKFTQSGDDHVTLAMSIAADVNPLIKIDQWGFNYGGGVLSLSYLHSSGVPEATNIYKTWDQKTKADGDGFFNLYFYFPSSGTTLSAGREVVYDLYGVGLEENSFLFKSAQYKDGSSSPTYSGYYSAIHALGTSPNDPGSWAGATSYVPIPATAWLLASGLIGLVVIRRRLKK